MTVTLVVGLDRADPTAVITLIRCLAHEDQQRNDNYTLHLVMYT